MERSKEVEGQLMRQDLVSTKSYKPGSRSAVLVKVGRRPFRPKSEIEDP
ncbi:MAG: hypothetical protein JRG73_13000 [Deltaproteobacteria bacterium]|nr:hypothetical protein [Deltaproteobacteria bacterium]